MQVEYGFIADSADAQNGLFYVVRGGTDIWHLPADVIFPVPIGPMSFVVRLVGQLDEIGQPIAVSFKLVNLDGHPVGEEGQGQIEFAPHPFDRTRTSGALLHFRVGFSAPSAGAFVFELHSNDRRLCQIPFWVVTGPPVNIP